MWKKQTVSPGIFTLFYENKPVHSKINPELEALKIVGNISSKLTPNIVVLGLGLGYHIRIVLEKLSSEYKHTKYFLLGVASSKEEHNIFFDYCPDLKEHPNCSFITVDQIFLLDKILDSYFKNINDLTPWFIFKYIPIYKIFLEKYQFFEEKWNERLGYGFQNLRTKVYIGHLWVKNIIKNLKYLSHNYNISGTGDAILVSAGFSAIQSIEFLKQNKRKCPIIAVDTILPTLIAVGILPDIIIACDAQVNNYYDFITYVQQKKGNIDNIILIGDITQYHKILEHFDIISIFKTDDMHPYLINMLTGGQINKTILSGGSVASFALYILYSIGFQRVVLVGQDLEYLPISHAISTEHFMQNLLSSHRFLPVFNKSKFWIQKAIHREAQDGMLYNLTIWISNFFQYYPIIGLRKNPSNVIIKNTEQYSHQELNGKIKKNHSHINSGVYKENLKLLLNLIEKIIQINTVNDFVHLLSQYDVSTTAVIQEVSLEAFLYKAQSQNFQEEEFLFILKKNLLRTQNWIQQEI